MDRLTTTMIKQITNSRRRGQSEALQGGNESQMAHRSPFAIPALRVRAKIHLLFRFT